MRHIHSHAMGKSAFAVTLILAAALALSACGRKGPLDRPGIATAPQERDTISGGFSSTGDTDAPPAKPDRPFILDPLIN